MSDQEPVTQWIAGLKQGDQEAARLLWERYFHRLVPLVRARLPGHALRAFDEEDVALSAFKSFCTGVAEDRFPDMHDRDNLWAVLVVIGVRKSQEYLKRQNRLKRGGGAVSGESAISGPDDKDLPLGLDALASTEPSPELTAQLAEECERLLDSLGDEALRAIAVLKMQGYTLEEIAERVGCTKRAVQRRLAIIRRTWSEASPSLDENET